MPRRASDMERFLWRHSPLTEAPAGRLDRDSRAAGPTRPCKSGPGNTLMLSTVEKGGIGKPHASEREEQRRVLMQKSPTHLLQPARRALQGEGASRVHRLLCRQVDCILPVLR